MALACTKGASLPNYSQIAAGLVLLTCSSAFRLVAQEVFPAPKILAITRESMKTVATGAPSHAIAAVSASGPPRVLFFRGYDSYGQWEKERASVATGQTLAAGAPVADGKDEGIWTRRDDLSLKPGFRAGSRAEVILEYRVRPGHAEEFEELVKLYLEGYKGVPAMHWATYEETYGSPGNVFLVIITHKSAAELDAEDENDAKFVEALGPAGLKKLAVLEAACLEGKQADLFFFDPNSSDPTEKMRKADPDFWGKR